MFYLDAEHPNPLTTLQDDKPVTSSAPLQMSFTSGRIPNKNRDLFQYKQEISF
jgi:hypothetical protein